jgi:hypothetical protein
MDDFDRELAELVREFERKGGKARPCLREDLERRARMATPPPPPKQCPHGRTLLTCPDCYFGRE